MFKKKITFLLRHPLGAVQLVASKLKSYYFLKVRSLMSRDVIMTVSSGVMVRQPSYFVGRGRINIGKGVIFGFRQGGYYRKNISEFVVREDTSVISIGSRTKFNNNIFMSAWSSISIGDDCLIGHNCEFSDADGHELDPRYRLRSAGCVESIVIGNNVWFGNGCKVLRGSRIGDNSIIAAGAVVKGQFGSNVVIGGVPARVLKEIELHG